MRDRKLELLVHSKLLSIQSLVGASILEYEKLLNRKFTSGTIIRNYMREIKAITSEVVKETLLLEKKMGG